MSVHTVDRARTGAGAGALCWSMPLPATVTDLLVLTSAQGLVEPNAGALASQTVPDHPGTGSAPLGFFQRCAAGVVAPLVGVGDEPTAVPMAGTVIVLTALSMGALAAARRQPRERPLCTLRG